jgi:hypothetical protein
MVTFGFKRGPKGPKIVDDAVVDQGERLCSLT